jgi:hypothetical protein
MNGQRPLPPQRVPTLTEVVEPLYRAPPAPPEVASDTSMPPQDQTDSTEAGRAEPPQGIDEAQLVERVLGELQRQVELMLEYRLREVLTPALVRATDALIRDARVELASTLRDVVARAVALELSRHRGD